MFDRMIPLIHKDSFIICDLNETLFTRDVPCKFTDLDGFIRLFKHIKGRILFLTKHKSKKEIKACFKQVHLKYDDFVVVYTDLPKGIFLKNYPYPKHTVFIDNSLRQIQSVQKHCPDILTIQFK
jgi:hypothetical protein